MSGNTKSLERKQSAHRRAQRGVVLNGQPGQRAQPINKPR